MNSVSESIGISYASLFYSFSSPVDVFHANRGVRGSVDEPSSVRPPLFSLYRCKLPIRDFFLL